MSETKETVVTEGNENPVKKRRVEIRHVRGQFECVAKMEDEEIENLLSMTADLEDNYASQIFRVITESGNVVAMPSAVLRQCVISYPNHIPSEDEIPF